MPPGRSVEPLAFSAFDRRDTTYYGLFGEVSESEAKIANDDMDSILTMGHQSIVMSVLFALLSIVFFMTVRYLLQDGMRRQSNRWMLVVLTVMYGTATVSYAFELLTLREYVRQTTYTFTGGRYGTPNDRVSAVTDAGKLIVQDINILCGDLIILWRTSVVWHNSRLIRRLNLAFSIVVILCWIAGIALHAVVGVQFWFLALALSLAVNIWSTTIIGYKTWHRRRLLRRHIFMAGRTSTAVEGALAVLTETGVVYLALWVVYVAIAAVYSFRSATSVHWIMSDRSFQWTVIVMDMLIPLYPFLVILLVARHKTPVAETLTSIDDDDSFDMPTQSANSTAENAKLHAGPNSDDKADDEHYDP
ncbi:hypothetical protein PENSPDRAFT_734458 [Peniophora sp. CONT]|nr:hypothetical protein PENSPDRAFT_734458 [Peniophora sp. CONT]